MTLKFLRLRKTVASQLRRNMASGVVTTVLNGAVAVVSYPTYLHYLGYDRFGVWIVLSTVISFIQMCNLGVGPAVTKLVAAEYGRGNVEAIESYVSTAVVAIIVAGLSALALVLCFSHKILGLFKLGEGNTQIALRLLPYVGVLTVYTFLVQVLSATLSGLGRMDQVNYRDSLCRILAFMVGVVLLRAGWGIESLLVGSSASSIAMHYTSQVLILRIRRLRLFRLAHVKPDHMRRLLRLGSGVFSTSLLSMLVSPFNRLMLSRYTGLEAVTMYEIVLQVSLQLRALFNSFWQPVMPEISRLATVMTTQAIARLRHINAISTKMTVMAGIPIYLTAIVFAGPLLHAWLRGQYVDTMEMPLRMMLVAGFANLASTPAYHVLVGLGHVRQCVLASVISTATNLILVTTLTASTGGLSVTLVAVSLALAWTVSSVYSIQQARRATAPLCSVLSIQSL